MVFDCVGASHFNAGSAGGLLRGHATEKLLRSGCFDELTQFIVHFALDPIPIEERADTLCDIA
jgi:hypothetical protein